MLSNHQLSDYKRDALLLLDLLSLNKGSEHETLTILDKIITNYGLEMIKQIYLGWGNIIPIYSVNDQSRVCMKVDIFSAAIIKNYALVVDKLIACEVPLTGKSISEFIEHDELTPLMIACKMNYENMVTILIYHDVNLLETDKAGRDVIAHIKTNEIYKIIVNAAKRCLTDFIRTTLPNNIEVKNKKFEGDITLAARDSVIAENISTNGSISVIAGVSSPRQVAEIEKEQKLVIAILKKNIVPFYSSTKLELLFSKNTVCELYTPDPDGFTRDDMGNVAGGIRANITSNSESNLLDDLKNISQHPENIEVKSQFKLR